MHSIDDNKALRIRTRRTLAGNGVVTTARSVSCPRRARELSPSACVACEHGDAVLRAGREAFIYCQHATNVPRPFSIAPYEDMPAKRTPITAIMTADVACVRPDVTLDMVAALVLELRVNGVPVVDSLGVPLGVVSKTDLVDAAYEHAGIAMSENEPDQALDVSACGLDCDVVGRSTRSTVADIMLNPACMLPETATVADAAALIVDDPMQRVLVTCSEGKLVGIVSTLDLVRWMVEQAD